MTREEAIKGLKVLRRDFSGYKPNEEMFDMAIKALEQEPCEDAISRKQAIYIASGFCHPANVADELAKLPSVNPQQKTGHWIEYTRVLIPEPINKWEQAWYCSECGYGNQECEDGSAWLEWKYCPNCGCRMVEPQESEDKEHDERTID